MEWILPRSLQKESARLIPWFQTSAFQNYQTMHSVSHWVCGNLVWQLWETHTARNVPPIVGILGLWGDHLNRRSHLIFPCHLQRPLSLAYIAHGYEGIGGTRAFLPACGDRRREMRLHQERVLWEPQASVSTALPQLCMSRKLRPGVFYPGGSKSKYRQNSSFLLGITPIPAQIFMCYFLNPRIWPRILENTERVTKTPLVPWLATQVRHRM